MQGSGDGVGARRDDRPLHPEPLRHRHIGAAQAILRDYKVITIVHPGDRRNGATIRRVRAAIKSEQEADVWDLSRRKLPFGTSFPLGTATVTFVAGWSDARKIYDADPPLDGSSHKAERYNGISLVIRFDYGGHSVLLSGDTLGRIEPRRVCRRP